jgi:hypothetical protein
MRYVVLSTAAAVLAGSVAVSATASGAPSEGVRAVAAQASANTRAAPTVAPCAASPTRPARAAGDNRVGLAGLGPLSTVGPFWGPTAIWDIQRHGTRFRGKMYFGLTKGWGGSMIVTAKNLRTGRAVRFQADGTTPGPRWTTAMRLTKARGTRFARPGGLEVDGPGCYRLVARWGTRSLAIRFEADEHAQIR